MAVATVPRLSGRETEVLLLVAAGLSNEEIADELSIALHTVKECLGGLRGKLRGHNRMHLVVTALKLGLIHLGDIQPVGARGLAPLSELETRVLELLVEGLNAKEAADRLETSHTSVLKAEVRIRRKWHVTTRPELVDLGGSYLKLRAVQAAGAPR